MIKTKTIATIGPGSSSEQVLSELLEHGVDVLRLNFSHGTLDQHKHALDTIRRVAREHDQAVAVMGDLSGPKIRIGKVDPQRSTLKDGQCLIIQRQDILGTSDRISSTYPQIIDEVRVGERVLIDDGHIELTVEACHEHHIVCHCIHGGTLSNHKGINLPDTQLNTPALTEKDCKDLAWAIEQHVDYVALSFVRNPSDIQMLRQKLDDASSDISIIAKIEKPQAVEHIDSIIDEVDAILVARGDLGVEMDLSEVPVLQKDITIRCQRAGKPVIIATQMLQSMVHSPTPTRAEVSDVANAILDMADAVMLSAETAIGDYPNKAVQTIQEICAKTESFQLDGPSKFDTWIEHKQLKTTSSLAQSARLLAERIGPPLIAVWTQSGNSARLLSKHRFTQPIIALTENPRTYNKLALNYGVIPMMTPCPSSTVDMLSHLDDILTTNHWASQGDTIIVIAGTHYSRTGGNNAMLIHKIGDETSPQ